MERRKACLLLVLWAAVHLSSPGYGLRALRRTTGGRRGSTGLTGQDANGVPLRRSKRGWMWNQFFLLEEYTGTDMQYVGKVVQLHTFSLFSFSRHKAKFRPVNTQTWALQPNPRAVRLQQLQMCPSGLKAGSHTVIPHTDTNCSLEYQWI